MDKRPIEADRGWSSGRLKVQSRLDKGWIKDG